MKATNDTEKLSFGSQETFEAWLYEDHDRSKGVWVTIAKNRTDGKAVSLGRISELPTH